MKKQFQFFVGIDVSKLKLDVCICSAGDLDWLQYKTFPNNRKGITQLMAWVKRFVTNQSTLFCLEHTGVYAVPVCCYLQDHEEDYCLVAAAIIQKTVRLKRGKNDKVDAECISSFARTHHSQLTHTHIPNKILFRLKTLLSYRDRLLRAKKMFEVAAGEMKQFLDKTIAGEVIQDSDSVVRQLEKKVEKVDRLVPTSSRLTISLSKPINCSNQSPE